VARLIKSKTMRNILLILALIAPVITFAQKDTKKHKKLLAHAEYLDEVKISEFLVHPGDYIPYHCKVAEIDRIEFKRDTNYSNTPAVYAEITEKDGFDQVYSIGQVSSYQRSETEVAFSIIIHMKDGSIDYKHVIFDFSNGVSDKEYDYQEASYDVEGEPFWDEWDGIEIVAL
jgi:hypothetical protein